MQCLLNGGLTVENQSCSNSLRVLHWSLKDAVGREVESNKIDRFTFCVYSDVRKSIHGLVVLDESTLTSCSSTNDPLIQNPGYSPQISTTL